MKEIIIVETENGEKIKRFLDREHETYKVYNEESKRIIALPLTSTIKPLYK